MRKFLIEKLFLIALMTFSCLAQAEPYGKIRSLGDYGNMALPLIGFLSTAVMSDKIGFQEDLVAYGMTVITTDMLKEVSHEQRPLHTDYNSFPSGHAAAAFSGAAFVHFRYGFKYALPMYAAATFVAYSRIYCHRHYIHDVIAGAALAVAFNALLVTRYEKPHYSVAFTPSADNGNLGLGVHLQIK